MAWLSLCKPGAASGSSNPDASLEGPRRSLKRRHTPVTEYSPEDMKLKAEHFRDGSFVTRFAEMCFHKAVGEMGRPEFDLLFEYGSVCSGSSMDAVACSAVNEACVAEDVQVNFTAKFLCEIDNAKRAFSRKVHESLSPLDEIPCAYHDLTTLHDDHMRTCGSHQQKACPLPGLLDLLMGGISCKDFARCNSNKAVMHGAKIFNSTSTPGKSADTMHGFTRLLDMAYPEMCIIENVDELADQNLHREALDMFLAGLASRGYDCKVFILNVAEFGIPQMKKRMYLLALLRPGRKFKVREGQAFFAKVQRLLELFKLEGPSLAEVLLPESDRTIQEALQRLEERPTKRGTMSSATLQQHCQAWTNLGQRFQVGGKQVRKSDAESPWFNALTMREQAVLEYHQKLRGKSRDMADRSAEGLMKHAQFAMLDVSQSIKFGSTSVLNTRDQLVSQTILPESRMYISLEAGEPLAEGRDIHRLITGEEALMLNGFPTRHAALVENVRSTSDHLLHNMGGNAFASVVVVALLTATIFSLDRSAQVDDMMTSSREETEMAMELIKKARAL